MRIAIIGSGIAGLACGWLLKQKHADGGPHNHVTVFERQPSLGMDAHSIDLPGPLEPAADGGNRLQPDPVPVRVDVPPRMFNRDEWRELSRLYETLGVQTTDVDASKSFADAYAASWLELGDRYADGFQALTSLGTQLIGAKVRAVAADVRRMTGSVTADALNAMPAELTLAEFLADADYSSTFVNEFLYPGLAATVLTCSYDALKKYPARIALRSLRNQVDQSPLQRTCYGTRDVVQRLTQPIDAIKLATVVAEIELVGDQVRVTDAGGATESFDHLVIATQANSAVRLLEGRSDLGLERTILERFEYEDVHVVVHRDDSFMPSRRAKWQSFNFASNEDRSDAMCTMWLNRFYPEHSFGQNIFQTFRPLRMPAAHALITQAAMQRPVVNLSTVSAVAQLESLPKEDRRLWFCGSYAANTVPLLESGVVSAQRVAEDLCNAAMGLPSK